jgi:hypothetical protein
VIFLAFSLAIVGALLFVVSVSFDPTVPPPRLAGMRFSLLWLLLLMTVTAVLYAFAAVLTTSG